MRGHCHEGTLSCEIKIDRADNLTTEVTTEVTIDVSLVVVDEGIYINLSKHIGEDPNTTRADETIGYLVIETGSGSINGIAFEAALGAKTVRGFGDSARPYTYTLRGNLTTASAAAASQSGMAGADGSWAVLSGAPAFTTTTLGLHTCEDQKADAEQWHATERIGYIVFE